jgi:antitoxin component YwqK of YwqJK toxin-antitoxin module
MVKSIFIILLTLSLNNLIFSQISLDYINIINDGNHYDTVVLESLGQDILIKKYWNYNQAKYMGKEVITYDDGQVYIGTWTNYSDTLYYDGNVIVFTNPFPDVYLHDDFKKSSTNLDPYSGETKGYSYIYYSNGSIKGKCILQDSKGTLYGTWYSNGKPESLGYYQNNKKSGKWKFWNKDGKLTSKVY